MPPKPGSPAVTMTITVRCEVVDGNDRWSGRVDPGGASPYEIIFAALVLLEGLSPADGKQHQDDPLPDIVQAIRDILDVEAPSLLQPVRKGMH